MTLVRQRTTLLTCYIQDILDLTMDLPISIRDRDAQWYNVILGRGPARVAYRRMHAENLADDRVEVW